MNGKLIAVALGMITFTATMSLDAVPAQARPTDPFGGESPYYSEQTVAMGGDGIFPNYRIPALAVAPSGDLLVSYDGRPTGIDAPGPNSILQRRSTDNGSTWQPTTTIRAGVASDPIHGYSDPSYVVDRDTGDIFNFHVRSGDVGLLGSHAGVDPTDRGVLHAQVSSSQDQGRTWQHRTITADITPDLTIRSRFAASGAGIQLRHGPHAGRLLQQFTIVTATGDFQAVSIYSDDHGATWRAGQPVGTRMDENKVVELSDGRVMLNSRDSAKSGFRKVAYSTDGGITYGPVRIDDELPDPANNASIIRAFPDAPMGSPEARILLFSNAASSTERAHGTVRASCDDGMNWPIAREFRAGEMAYSTLAMLPDGRVAMAYEPGHNGIVTATFNLAWLRGMCTSIEPQQKLTIERGGSSRTTVELTNQSGSVQRIVDVAPSAPKGFTVDFGRPESTSGGGRSTQHPRQNKTTTLPSGKKASLPVSVHVDAAVTGGTYRIPIIATDTRGRTARGHITVEVPRLPIEVPGAIEVSGGNLVAGQPTSPKQGDKLEFTYTVRNASSATTTVTPSGNLRDLDPAVDQRNCRWRDLAPGASYTCVYAHHVVTEQDMANGSFTPVTRWVSASGRDTTVVEHRGSTVRLG